MAKPRKSSKKPLSSGSKVEIFIALAFMGLIAISGSSFDISNITGFTQFDIVRQNLDLLITESQFYELDANADTPFYIKSLRFSGEIVGNSSL